MLRRLVVLMLSVVVALAGVGSAIAEEPAANEPAVKDPLAKELADLQGKWALRAVNHRKVEQRVEKEIRGYHEAFRVYNADGSLLRAHQAEIRLERTGDMLIYHWANAVVTDGPNAGQKIPDGSGVYRLADGKWISVSGLNENSPLSVAVEFWERLPAEVEKPAEK